MLTVGVQTGQFNVSEDIGEVVVCVAFLEDNIAEFSVPVTISTMDVTATGWLMTTAIIVHEVIWN